MILNQIVNKGLLNERRLVVDIDGSDEADPIWLLEQVKKDAVSIGYEVLSVYNHPTEKGVFQAYLDKQ